MIRWVAQSRFVRAWLGGPAGIVAICTIIVVGCAPVQSSSSLPSPPVAGWVQGPGTCLDPDEGVSVPVPAGWYANEQDGGLAPCRLFTLDAVEIDDPANPPSVAITLMLVAAGSELGFVTEEEVVEEQDIEIGGLPARRFRTEGLNGPRMYYVIGIEGSMPSESNPVPYVLVATNYGEASFEEDSEAISQIATGFLLDR